MTTKLDDSRLQFYLRNRPTIREWAAIEEEVRSLVSGLLKELQGPLERKVRARDPRALTGRLDGSGYRRITLRRDGWPTNLSIAIEWARARVDPFGGGLPKIGVFYLADGDADKATRKTVLAALQAAGGLAEAGYTVNAESVWLTLRYVPKSDDWWTKPDEWTGWIEAEILRHWELCTPIIDRALGLAAKG